jgi:hypothetical protein
MSSGDSLKEAGLDNTDVEDMPTMGSEDNSQMDSMVKPESSVSDSAIQEPIDEVEPEPEPEPEPEDGMEPLPGSEEGDGMEPVPGSEEGDGMEPLPGSEQGDGMEPVPGSEPGDGMESETSEVSVPPSGEKALSVLKKATNFRKKLTTTKRKLPSLDDADKDKIRTELIHEFTNILKLYKNKTTRKKYIRRLNGLRTVFNQSLNKLNGTTRQRKRKTKARKAKSIPEEEEMSQMSSPTDEEVSQMPADTNEM